MAFASVNARSITSLMSHPGGKDRRFLERVMYSTNPGVVPPLNLT